jgi:hypothetical protein
MVWVGETRATDERADTAGPFADRRRVSLPLTAGMRRAISSDDEQRSRGGGEGWEDATGRECEGTGPRRRRRRRRNPQRRATRPGRPATLRRIRYYSIITHKSHQNQNLVADFWSKINKVTCFPVNHQILLVVCLTSEAIGLKMRRKDHPNRRRRVTNVYDSRSPSTKCQIREP